MTVVNVDLYNAYFLKNFSTERIEDMRIKQRKEDCLQKMNHRTKTLVPFRI